jgi:uncharacterized membrane protein (DUF485 family)
VSIIQEPTHQQDVIEAAPVAPKVVELRHGDHVDTIESVNRVFVQQRRLAFTYGAVFFLVTLLIPAFSVWWPWWYSVEIWGGFTANYFVVALLYFVFLWVMAWVYSMQADKLDGQLATMDIEEQQRLEVENIRQAAAALDEGGAR